MNPKKSSAIDKVTTLLDSASNGNARQNPRLVAMTSRLLPNTLISRPATGIATTEPIAAIINDRPRIAGLS
jgi:hypothetical protein